MKPLKALNDSMLLTLFDSKFRFDSFLQILPEACPNQQVMVHLVSAIRVMPIDTLVQTVHQVVKSPPPIHGVKQDFSLEVSVLELLYVYMQSNTSQSLVESWPSLLGLLKDSLALTAPAQFLLLAILNEYIQKCPPMQEKKDIRDLQDITAKVCLNVTFFYHEIYHILIFYIPLRRRFSWSNRVPK